MKAHEKRFIIEVLGMADGKDKWIRSGNSGLQKFYATREEAQTALIAGEKSSLLEYRVRQK